MVVGAAEEETSVSGAGEAARAVSYKLLLIVATFWGVCVCVCVCVCDS